MTTEIDVARIDADTLELAFDHAMLAGPYICVGTTLERHREETFEALDE